MKDLHAEELNGVKADMVCPHCQSIQTIKIELGGICICGNCQSDFELEVRVDITNVIGHKPTRRAR